MLCSHMTSAFASTLASPSKFNIAPILTQTQIQRMGSEPVVCVNVCIAIGTMLNFDGNANTDADSWTGFEEIHKHRDNRLTRLMDGL